MPSINRSGNSIRSPSTVYETSIEFLCINREQPGAAYREIPANDMVRSVRRMQDQGSLYRVEVNDIIRFIFDPDAGSPCDLFGESPEYMPGWEGRCIADLVAKLLGALCKSLQLLKT